MRLLPSCVFTAGLLFAAAFLLPAQPATEETAAVAAVQRIFDGMAAHDGDMIRAAMLPDARIYSAREAAAPAGVDVAAMATRIATGKVALTERFIGKPRVSIQGRIAQVWGEYEFFRDGKFSHCGVDAASLYKTESGWKVATLAYTVETSGCKGH